MGDALRDAIDEAFDGMDADAIGEHDAGEGFVDDAADQDASQSGVEGDDLSDEVVDDATTSVKPEDDGPSDPLAKYRETRNVEDLPDEMQQIARGWQAEVTRKLQEVADMRRDLLAQAQQIKPQQQEKAAEAPAIDLDATPEELARQIEARVAYEVANATKGIEAKTQTYEQKMAEIERQRSIDERMAYVQGKPGFSAEVEMKMAQLAGSNPFLAQAVNSREGLDILFNMATESLGATRAASEEAQAAEKAKANSQLRARSGKARDMSPSESVEGLDPIKAIDKIFADAKKRL